MEVNARDDSVKTKERLGSTERMERVVATELEDIAVEGTTVMSDGCGKVMVGTDDKPETSVDERTDVTSGGIDVTPVGTADERSVGTAAELGTMVMSDDCGKVMVGTDDKPETPSDERIDVTSGGTDVRPVGTEDERSVGAAVTSGAEED